MVRRRALSRREFIKIGAGVGTLSVLAATTKAALEAQSLKAQSQQQPVSLHGGHAFSPSGFVRPRGFDPMKFLTTFDYGRVTHLGDGRAQREFELVAMDKEIEVAPGVRFPAWTFNGTVPGPTIRCQEGDMVKLHFLNKGTHHHTIHMHGIHPGKADGVFELIPPDGTYTYELTADPFGVFLYHCHVLPLRKHIAKGLYGAFIVDPPTPRPPATEFIMVMNGFDTDFDGENEFYTVNGFADYYQFDPIKIRVGQPIRIYLVNLTEFDPINSFHLHGNVFKLYRTGTSLTHYEVTDTVMLCQGERAILEFNYKHPGRYMFHAHQSEFAEQGWTGIFEVT